MYSCVYFLLKSENNTAVVLSEGTKLMWCSAFILEYVVGSLEEWAENKSRANSLGHKGL